MSSDVFKTAAGAERASGPRECCGHSRSGIVPYDHGFIVVLWWGTTSHPTDARVYGPGNKILADGVEATEKFLGL